MPGAKGGGDGKVFNGKGFILQDGKSSGEWVNSHVSVLNTTVLYT